MKKLAAILIFTVMLVNNAFGGSLFPSLMDPEPLTAPDKAPSYSGYAGVFPDDTMPYAEGGEVLVYNNVEEEKFYDFGDYLKQFGFEVSASNVIDTTIEVMLDNGTFNLGVTYNVDTRTLKLIYDEGVEWEEPEAFPGYKRVEMGDEIEVKGMGTIQLNSFTFSHNFTFQFQPSNNIDMTILSFSFYNKATTPLRINQVLGTVKLVYINKDNRYEIDAKQIGILYASRIEGSENIGSLTRKSCAVEFAPPQGLKEATDGTLAITMEINNDTADKYVLFLRENGKKNGEWEKIPEEQSYSWE